jgi:hypothetical protein
VLKQLPWQVKTTLKLVTGMLPLDYESLRSRLTGYKGMMVDPKYSRKIWDDHFTSFQAFRNSRSNGCFLELGPGASLLSGFYALNSGFLNAILIDVGKFAILDDDFYKSILTSDEPASQSESLSEKLSSQQVEYKYEGLRSLQSLPSASVDFSFSQAVLEHVKRSEFDGFLAELYRVHKTSSVSSHRIDFKDHLGGLANNLRFRSSLWEHPLFTNQGFYTNRIRLDELILRLGKVGFEVIDLNTEKWQEAPLDRKKLAPEFQKLSHEDLMISAANIVLRKPK